MTREEKENLLREAVGILIKLDNHMITSRDNAEFSQWVEDLIEQPQQRTGYWIMHFDEISPSDSTMECSECGEELTVMYVKGDYCPNCGSKNKVKHGDKKK